MGGSTLELVFLVGFGLVALFQFVRNFLRRKAAEARQAQQAQEAQSPPHALAGAKASPSAAPLSSSWGRGADEGAVLVGTPVPQPPEPPTLKPRTPVRAPAPAAASQPGMSNVSNASNAPRAPYAQNTHYPRRRVYRFSRAALMGDRRAVQDAVVIAAVLRPCHAHQPYGTEG
jgi:hypothetical protein